jgi:hypothetical protein
MADEVFALSPISARASLPSEADYDAIREAFMETSRGRWFLGEYAKRNRNADTSMVLDAVARIEETLAAQRRQQAQDVLADALAVIRSAVDEAAQAIGAAFDGAAVEASLAPIRKGARIIKEISWRWREIGADGRICDLIDSQLGAIEAECERIGRIDPGTAVNAAFDLIKRRIDGLGKGDHAGAAMPAGAEAAAAPTAPPEPAARPVEQMRATDEVEAAFREPEMPVEATAETTEPVETTADTAAEIVEPMEVPADTIVATVAPVEMQAPAVAETVEPVEMTAEAAEPVELTAEAADAHDEAVLEMVALEMAASDPDEAIEPFGADSNGAAALPRAVEPIVVAPEPVEAPPQAAGLQPSLPPQPLSEPAPPASREPSVEPSLGSTLLASGFLQRPKAADPLAPIRRLSQAEKIALFS